MTSLGGEDDVFKIVGQGDPNQVKAVLQRKFSDVSLHKKLLCLRNERKIGLLAHAIVKNKYESFVAICEHLGHAPIEPRFDTKPRPQDDERDNLLLTAVRYYTRGGKAIAEYILDKVGSDAAFIRYEPKQRCALHEAADKGYDEVFERLRAARPQLKPQHYALKDTLGQTPLHLAADRGHPDVVRVLLQAAPKLDLVMDNIYENALWKAVQMGRKEVVDMLLTHRPGIVKIKNEPPSGPNAKSGHKGRRKSASMTEARVKSVYELACEANRSRLPGIMSEPAGLQRSNTYDSSIKAMLKEHILRLNTTSREKRDLLSVAERGKEIYLDLTLFTGLARDEGRFSIYLEGLVGLQMAFLDCLEFVKLPDLSCKYGDTCEADTRGYRLESEAVKVFDFLRRNEVKRVLAVDVPDCPTHPHTTSDILTSLHGLNPRSLNWRKIDIDLSMLLNAVPFIESIHLYSSGNQDVLNSWCGFEGLMQFPDLREISITIYRGEMPDRELEELRQRAQERLKSYKFHDDHPLQFYFERGLGYIGSRIASAPCECSEPRFKSVDVQLSAWQNAPDTPAHLLPDFADMKTQETFFSKVRPIKEFFKKFRSSERRDCRYTRERPVRVAIIDSGIAPNLDPEYDFYDVREGKSFVEDVGDDTGDSHWHIVSNYHGSQLAQIVAATNPYCAIYAAKVYHGNQRGGVDEDAAIEAIQWASTKNVDIIVMSWTVSEASSKELGRLNKRFRKVLHKASERCLLFASTRDGAATNVPPYPASDSNVFAISSCPMDGRITHDVAKNDNTRYYYLPGENFQLHVPKYLVSSGVKVDSGSSLATAAAAGTASLLLTCARFAFHREERDNSSTSPPRFPSRPKGTPELNDDAMQLSDDSLDRNKKSVQSDDWLSEQDEDASQEDDEFGSDNTSHRDQDAESDDTSASEDGTEADWFDSYSEDNNVEAEKAFKSLRSERMMREAFRSFSDTENRVKIWETIGPEFERLPMGEAKGKLHAILEPFVG